MCDKHYQDIPITKFIYRYDDTESVMQTLKIKDEDIAEIIVEANREEEDKNLSALIEKLHAKKVEIETDLDILENCELPTSK